VKGALLAGSGQETRTHELPRRLEIYYGFVIKSIEQAVPRVWHDLGTTARTQ
jgi:hypothetical protein